MIMFFAVILTIVSFLPLTIQNLPLFYAGPLHHAHLLDMPPGGYLASHSCDVHSRPKECQNSKHMRIRPPSSLDRNCRFDSVDWWSWGDFSFRGHRKTLSRRKHDLNEIMNRITEATNIYCYQNINASCGDKLSNICKYKVFFIKS